MTTETPYTIAPARYAKGKLVIKATDGRNGFKGRACYLAEAVGGRWVGRSSGYVVSSAAAAKFEALYAAGFTGCSFASKEEAVTRSVGQRMSIAAALKLIKAESAQ